MKTWIEKNLDYVSWDRLGMGLSLLCGLHCLLTPLIILSLPILARYYLAHPYFHLLLAIAIVPIGLVAFFVGYRHHGNFWVFVLGIPGLVLVAGVPYMVHGLGFLWNEPLLMVSGSALLITAHWFNRRTCTTCDDHAH
jgi:hypothetical protein